MRGGRRRWSGCEGEGAGFRFRVSDWGAVVTKGVTGLEIAHQIEQRFPGAVVEAVEEFAVIAPEKLVEVVEWLRDDAEQMYKFLS